MNYRPEIDGLRAVAVLPVILFHAGFSIFSGGFVGVDVFFVISGYLITTILIQDIEQGKFSISRFYERRARRILPALFVVIIACLPFAWMWMMPYQLKDFSASIASLMLAISNVFFLSQVNYFAPDADLQPLLHTWSLSIEEQYYFLFPLALFLLRNNSGKTKFSAIFFLVLASLAFSEWGARENPARSYFFTLSRFWEIGVGSLISIIETPMSRKVRKYDNLLSASGLSLIIFSIFCYDENTPFPRLQTH